MRDVHLRQLFTSDPGRGTRLTAEGAGLFLDYSKNRVTEWLKVLGYRVSRTVQIDRPHQPRPAPAPAPAPAGPRASEYDRLDQPARSMPFNFPAPGAVFSNVPMPGFQE